MPVGECSIASDLVRLFEMYRGSDGYQTGGKMSDGHLIAYGSKRVMRCLFCFSVAESREVLLNGLPVLEDFLEFFTVLGTLERASSVTSRYFVQP